MKYTYTYLILLFIMLSGCYKTEDYIIQGGYTQLAVDGSVNYYEDSVYYNGDTIQLSYSKAYGSKEDIQFENNAFVTITDHIGNIDTLKFAGTGKYITQKLAPVKGGIYTLNVRLANGEVYTATTLVPVRSAIFKGLVQTDTCRISGTPFGAIPKGIFVDLDAYDPAGAGDAYWVKTFVKRIYKDQSPYNNAASPANQGGVPYSPWKTFRNNQNIVITLDFTGSAISEVSFSNPVDSKFFLSVRLFSAMYNEEQSDYPAYYPGDSLKVSICSVTMDHLGFLSAVKRELANGTGGGLSGLFATPPSNVPTNIFNKDPNGKKAVGWFGGSVIISKAIQIRDFPFITDQSKNPSAYSCK